MKLFKYIGWIVPLLLFGFLVTTTFASSLPVGTTQFYLAGAGVGNTANSIQLTSFKTPDGRNITMAMFGTIGYGAIDPQTSVRLEDVSFTGVTQNVNGTATLTGVSRGLDFVYPYTASTTLAYSHSGGATFIITNTAGFYYNEFTMNNNNNLFTYPSASTSPATKGYVDTVAFNGAAVVYATTGSAGVSQLATGAQAAAGTAIGSSGASLALTSSIATSTFNHSTSANVVVVTGSGTGHIDPLFLYPTGATTTWPTNNGAASSTVLENDSNGNLSWNPLHTYTLFSTTAQLTTSQTSTTTVLTVPIAANTINGSTATLRITADWYSSIASGCTYGLTFGNGAATSTVGFDYATQTAWLVNNMYATTTASQAWTSDGTRSETLPGGFGAATKYYGNSFSAVSLTAKTYLGFTASSSAVTTPCNLQGATVEVVGQ